LCKQVKKRVDNFVVKWFVY